MVRVERRSGAVKGPLRIRCPRGFPFEGGKLDGRTLREQALHSAGSSHPSTWQLIGPAGYLPSFASLTISSPPELIGPAVDEPSRAGQVRDPLPRPEFDSVISSRRRR